MCISCNFLSRMKSCWRKKGVAAKRSLQALRLDYRVGQKILTRGRLALSANVRLSRHRVFGYLFRFRYYLVRISIEWLLCVEKLKGSAHGLAGIFQILLSFPEYLNENHEAHSLLKQSVDFVLSLQKPNGNFPIAMDDATHAQPRHDSKELVHWCHGSGGVIFMLAKAFLTWREQKYLTACLRCGELIWSRGLLKKGPGICHGVGEFF